MTISKKKLPKVIRRTPDDMHEAKSVAGARDYEEAVARATASSETATAPTSSPESTRPANIIDVTSAPREFDAARRKSQAHRIVERHAAYSAVGGIIPLPIANVASITAVIVRMVKLLSDLYGVPFERDRARAIVVGLVGGAMPTGLAAVTASTLVYVVPGSNLIGLAVSSITAIASTRSIGRIFVEHFESGASLIDFPAMNTS